MLKKILLATVTTVFLVLSAGASADMVANVYSCTLKEGKTSEDAHAVNGEWLKWARAHAGTDGIKSSYTTAIVGDLEGFTWVDTYESLAVWAKVNDAVCRTSSTLMLVRPGSGELGGDPAEPYHYRSSCAPGNFRDYARAIDGMGKFDLVMVDGRARASCIVHAVPKVRRTPSISRGSICGTTTRIAICQVLAPLRVLLPQDSLRAITAGRSCRSAKLLVASTQS